MDFQRNIWSIIIFLGLTSPIFASSPLGSLTQDDPTNCNSGYCGQRLKNAVSIPLQIAAAPINYLQDHQPVRHIVDTSINYFQDVKPVRKIVAIPANTYQRITSSLCSKRSTRYQPIRSWLRR